MNREYRPDIDGLRAFAVFSVILFHLDFEIASGGFVGVDIFFVISGFLITGIIKKEVEDNARFSFTDFYIRRLRRLFPALFVTILFSCVLSVLLFSPPHLERVGGSIIHALSSMSNFYFWTEAGYFDSATDVKPLLHTWSLSIEEQFYLVWPFLFVLLIKRKSRILLMFTFVGVIVISLYLNYLFQDGHVKTVSRLSAYAGQLIADGRATIFYLLPFRLYEFAIGGMLVYISGYPLKTRVANELIMLVGVALIAYSIIVFSEHTVFPSYNGMLPCIGAALIIYSGRESTYLGKLFKNKMAIAIGLISYSLYLVHWPIIVFWKYYTFKNITLAHAFMIIALSLCVAAVMYKYIESPFRLRKNCSVSHKPIAAGAVTALFICSFVVVVSSNMWVNQGWPWRLDKTPSGELSPPAVSRVSINELNEKTKWTNAYIIGPKQKEQKHVLVLGDSHANQLQGTAQYLSEKYNLSFTFFTFTGCPPIFGTYKVYGAPEAISEESLKQRKCREQTAIWEEYVVDNKFDYVILSSRWNWLFEPRKYYDTIQRRDLLVDKLDRQFTVEDSKSVFCSFLDYTVKVIHDSGAKAIIFGQVPNAGFDLEGCDNVPRFLISEKRVNERCNHVPSELVVKRSQFSNEAIRRIALANNAFSVIPTDYFCPKQDEFCQVFYKTSRLKDDDDHINKYGAVFLAKKWEMSRDFPFREPGQNSL